MKVHVYIDVYGYEQKPEDFIAWSGAYVPEKAAGATRYKVTFDIPTPLDADVEIEGDAEAVSEPRQ